MLDTEQMIVYRAIWLTVFKSLIDLPVSQDETDVTLSLTLILVQVYGLSLVLRRLYQRKQQVATLAN